MRLKLPLALLSALLCCYVAPVSARTINYFNPTSFGSNGGSPLVPNAEGVWSSSGSGKAYGNISPVGSANISLQQIQSISFTSTQHAENNFFANMYLNLYAKEGGSANRLDLEVSYIGNGYGKDTDKFEGVKTTWSTNSGSDQLRFIVQGQMGGDTGTYNLSEIQAKKTDWDLSYLSFSIGDTANTNPGVVDIYDITLTLTDGTTHVWRFMLNDSVWTVSDTQEMGDKVFAKNIKLAGGNDKQAGALIYMGWEAADDTVRLLGGSSAITEDSTFTVSLFQRNKNEISLDQVVIDKVDNTPITREDALITFEKVQGKTFSITNLKATDSGTHTVEGNKFGNQLGSIVHISGADSVILADSVFTGCTGSAKAPSGTTYGIQGTVYFNSIKDVKVRNVQFSGNSISSTGNSALGGAISTWGSSIAIEGVSFDNNSVCDLGYLDDTEAAVVGSAVGGAIYFGASAWGGHADLSAFVKDTSFINNQALGYVDGSGYGIARGGAIFLENRWRNVPLNQGDATTTTEIPVTIEDSIFTGNLAASSSHSDSLKGGGAIFSHGASVTIKVVKSDLVYQGNSATLDGIAQDNLGGFLNLYSSSSSKDGVDAVFQAKANFDIAHGRSLTIGEGKAGFDSIAGNVGSLIRKTGAGKMFVNSSMEFYQGDLKVEAGIFALNSSILGAASVSVSQGATFIGGATGVDLKTTLATATGVLTAEAGATLGTYLSNTGEIVKVKHSDVMNSIQNAYGIKDVTYTYWTQGLFNIDFSSTDDGSVGGLGEGSTVTVTGKGEELADGAINLAGGTADMTNVTGDIKGTTVTGDTGSMLTNDTQTVVFSSDQNVGYGIIGKDADGNTVAGASLVVGTDTQTNETAPVLVLTGDIHSKEITLKGGNLTLSNNTVKTDVGLTVGDNSTPAKATLTNNGTIIGDVTVHEGNTLKGSGTYIGAVKLTKSTFVVGNSPGQTVLATGSSLSSSDSSFLFTVDGTKAAVQGESTSGTYSNIILHDTVSATGTGNTATIEVWKGLFDATSTQLNLTLINNEGAGSIAADFFKEVALVTGKYAELLKNAKISLDAEKNVILTGTLDSSYAQSIIAVDAQAYANSLWSSSQVVSDFGKLSRDQASAPRNKELNLWMSAMGDFSSITGEQGYTYNGGGYGIGGDYAFNKSWIAGAGFGQTWGTNKTDTALLSNKQQGSMFSLYGQYAKELSKTKTFLVDGYFGYGQVENKATEALNMTAPAKWNDNVYTAGLRTSWAMEAGKDFIVTPFVALDFVTATQGVITAGSRSYNDGKMHNLSMPIGINFAKKFSLGGSHYLIPSLSVAYAPDISRQDPSVRSAVLGEDVKFTGAKPGRNAAIINVGTRWIMSRNWSTAVNYTLEARPTMTNQAVNLSVNYSF